MKPLMLMFSFFLLGCPVEEDDCQKVMVCEEDKEMYCYEMDNGCIDECHYYVFENCFEVCQ